MSDGQPQSDLRPLMRSKGNFFDRLLCALLGNSVNKDQ
jgi:hypothetical protein